MEPMLLDYVPCITAQQQEEYNGGFLPDSILLTLSMLHTTVGEPD